MIDLENSVNNLSPKNLSQAELDTCIDLDNSVNNLGPIKISQAELETCIEKLSKLFMNSARTTLGIKRLRNIKDLIDLIVGV